MSKYPKPKPVKYNVVSYRDGKYNSGMLPDLQRQNIPTNVDSYPSSHKFQHSSRNPMTQMGFGNEGTETQVVTSM